MTPLVVTYLAYLLLSVGLTVWVGRTLHSNGRVFLLDIFSGNDALAASVNHLLVVGFYLVNFGFVALALKTSLDVETARRGLELVASKVGRVLLVLGAMHFLNLYVFSRIRRRTVLGRMLAPPLAADGTTRIAKDPACAG